MDPLTGATSAISIISLALQLAQSCSNIKRFLDAIHNVPAEVVRLKGVILQLYLITATTMTLLEHQQDTPAQNDQISANIYYALNTCQKKVDLIRGVMQTAEKIRKGSTASRSWAQFKLAFKTEQVEEFGTQLEQAISFLNSALLLNVIYSNITTNSDIESLRRLLSSSQATAFTTSRSSSGLNSRALNLNSQSPIPNSSQSYIQKDWSNSGKLDIKFRLLTRRGKMPSMLLRVKVYNSYMVTVHLFNPIVSWYLPMPLTISMQNLVPADSAIMNACREGDGHKVKQLLRSRYANPNDITLSNDTPLSIAIKKGFEELVQLLLCEGADPNLCCGKGDISMLQVGVFLGMPRIVRMLIRHGADPSYVSARGWSLLHYMFGMANPPSTEYCLIFRDSLVFDEIKDSEGWTALHRCAAFGTGECIHNLHLMGASACPERYLTNWGGTPVHIAAMMNNVSTLKELIALYMDSNATQETLVGNTYAIDLIDFHGWAPLHLAAYRGAIDTMRWLLQKGADPHRRTFQTANWFPDGHEGETFDVASLARISGTACLDVFLETLRDMDCDVFKRGDEIYWPT
ncbi:hypothetical protein O1611_g2482 [Lasiodiplodia mahajangana]|uniref:Uncharacterized protein n=1 Tax=Lasiodiplodia mahajangana TaxID=1108764 RepID=A0ACC2JUJ1_9PEZI|nr:hypothetical protein O1611_g2482 [Lasiodiplodia mahajangana]